MSIIIDILKFLISKDFRESLKELSHLNKGSKKWKQDIDKSSGTFTKSNKEDLAVILTESMTFLFNNGWSEQERTNARFIFWELIENAYSYGIINENDCIIVDLTSSKAFWKVEISDQGSGFELEKELLTQGAFEYSKEKEIRGLGLICRITPHLSNIKTKRRHCIKAILFKGQGIINISELNGITIFEVTGNAFESPYYWDKFINSLNSLSDNSRILLSFVTIDDLKKIKKEDEPERHVPKGAPTRVIRDFEKVLKSNKKNLKIALFGLNSFSFEIAEYFKTRFKTFEDLNSAIKYLSEN